MVETPAKRNPSRVVFGGGPSAVDLSQRQGLEQQQTLHLTTELRQGLVVLQLNANDLADYLSSAIEENPVFVDAFEARASEGPHMRQDEERSQGPNGEASFSTADANRTLYSGFDSRIARVSADALMESRGHGRPESFGNERRDMSQRTFSFDRYLEAEETLQEHLMSQLRVMCDDQRICAIGDFLAGNLDSNGYLTISVEEAAHALGIEPSEVQEALALLQQLSPIGVAARNLSECLRLQLQEKGLMTPVLDMLLDRYLGELEKKSPASVARDMGVAAQDLEEALECIRMCDPRPGAQFGSQTEPVWPEVVVERNRDGGYQVRLQDMYLPELKIDEQYRTLAATSSDKAARDYLKEKLREAEGVIEGVAYRNATLYKVASCIAELQVEFFDEGFDRLRPLTMAQVAEIVNVSVSTVSRLANGNYMQTPRGTFELRFFFHGSALSDASVEVSAVSVKKRIQQIVEGEDSKKPLSDQAICSLLQDDGVDISRRTVAKYRDQLGIPVRAARKR